MTGIQATSVKQSDGLGNLLDVEVEERDVGLLTGFRCVCRKGMFLPFKRGKDQGEAMRRDFELFCFRSSFGDPQLRAGNEGLDLKY